MTPDETLADLLGKATTMANILATILSQEEPDPDGDALDMAQRLEDTLRKMEVYANEHPDARISRQAPG